MDSALSKGYAGAMWPCPPLLRLSLPRLPRAALALAALAVAVRVLIPAGYMVAADPAQAGTLVICTGHGALTVAIDAHGVPLDPSKPAPAPDRTEHPCAFAGAQAALAAPLPTALAQPAYHPRPRPAKAQRTLRPGLGLAAPPPPTTGPPTQLI